MLLFTLINLFSLNYLNTNNNMYLYNNNINTNNDLKVFFLVTMVLVIKSFNEKKSIS